MYALRVTKKRERAARSMLVEFEGLSRLLSLPQGILTNLESISRSLLLYLVAQLFLFVSP